MMEIRTTFNCGDKGWVYMDRPCTLTIGQVRVEITESPGIEQDGIQFDNYLAKSSRREMYMCVETGIGSGNVWELGKTIFPTEAECIAANAEAIQRAERLAQERRDEERRHLLRQESSLRATLEKIEQIKAETAEASP